MRIIVNHLTRMRRGFFCTAGIEFKSGCHIRPGLAHVKGLPVNMLRSNGGCFDMAVDVELGDTQGVGQVPEIEDHEFRQRAAKIIREVEPNEFWHMLSLYAKNRLTDIFGHDLRNLGNNHFGVDPRRGNCSLGLLRPGSTPSLRIKSRAQKPDQVRMHFIDRDLNEVDLSVADIRLYTDDYASPKSDLVNQINRSLQHGEEIILSVGLTRLFAPADGSEAKHWLQVNNIHRRDRPVWRLG